MPQPVSQILINKSPSNPIKHANVSGMRSFSALRPLRFVPLILKSQVWLLTIRIIIIISRWKSSFSSFPFSDLKSKLTEVISLSCRRRFAEERCLVFRLFFSRTISTNPSRSYSSPKQRSTDLGFSHRLLGHCLPHPSHRTAFDNYHHALTFFLSKSQVNGDSPPLSSIKKCCDKIRRDAPRIHVAIMPNILLISTNKITLSRASVM